MFTHRDHMRRDSSRFTHPPRHSLAKRRARGRRMSWIDGAPPGHAPGTMHAYNCMSVGLCTPSRPVPVVCKIAPTIDP
jgi:hypothetical protein